MRHRGFNLDTAKSKDMGLEFSGHAKVSLSRINHLRRQKLRDGKVWLTPLSESWAHLKLVLGHRLHDPPYAQADVSICHLTLLDSCLTGLLQEKHAWEGKWWQVLATGMLQMQLISCAVFIKNTDWRCKHLYQDHRNRYAEMVHHHRFPMTTPLHSHSWPTTSEPTSLWKASRSSQVFWYGSS